MMRSTQRLAVALVVSIGATGWAVAEQPRTHHPSSAGENEPWVELTVIRRDSLIALCRQVLVSPKAWREVASFNHLADPNVLLPGQVLRVPARLVKTMPVDGQIIDIEGEVRATDASGVHAMQTGENLTEGTQVATTEHGSVVVGLADGSSVRVLPNSLATLSASRVVAGRTARGVPAPASVAANAPSSAPTTGEPHTWTPASDGWFVGTMRLVRGSMEVLASKITRAKPLEVETPTTVVGVRGTDYRVGVDAVSEGADALPATHVEVLDGRVQVDAKVAQQGKRAGTLLASGHGAYVNAQGAMQLETLLPAPELDLLPALVEVPLVRFDWPHAVPVRVQVSQLEDFDEVVFDEKIAPGEPLRIAGLDDGTWHMRVRQVSGSGIEGYDATHVFSLNARPEPPATQSPRPKSKQPVGNVLFAWAPNAEAANSRLQIARDAAFTQVVDQRDGLAGDSVTLAVQEPGSYFWRLSSVSVLSNGIEDIGPWSVAQPFEVRPLPIPPTGRYDADGALVLSWGDVNAEADGKAAQEGLRYAAELSLDEQFTTTLAKTELNVPQWRIKGASWHTEPGDVSATGTAYFRYRTIEPDGYVSPPSAPLKVELPRDPRSPWLLLLPPALLLL